MFSLLRYIDNKDVLFIAIAILVVLQALERWNEQRTLPLRSIIYSLGRVKWVGHRQAGLKQKYWG